MRLMKAHLARALTEISFIIFLFYANLLMGEFERSGRGEKLGFLWALQDVLTLENFLLAIAASIVGYLVVEYLRKKY